MNAVLVFEPPFRSDKVLAHAKGQLCTLRFRVCNRNPETTVPCHIRDSYKGMGIKSSDSSIAFGCFACHVYLDESRWVGDITELVLVQILMRAKQETLDILIRDKVIGFPHNEPKKRRTRPRKAKGKRQAVPPSRPLQGRTDWPDGRPIVQRNNLRKRP